MKLPEDAICYTQALAIASKLDTKVKLQKYPWCKYVRMPFVYSQALAITSPETRVIHHRHAS